MERRKLLWVDDDIEVFASVIARAAELACSTGLKSEQKSHVLLRSEKGEQGVSFRGVLARACGRFGRRVAGGCRGADEEHPLSRVVPPLRLSLA